MSSLFRRKLSCFYCGHQVSVQALRGVDQYPNGRLRRFNCPDCSADNHLDENGEILDYVPDSPPKPTPVFARRRQSPRALRALTHRTTLKPAVGPDNSPPPSPTFCRTCLHNQQIVTNAIATYDLPPEDHPDYDEHVNYLFPLRRKELEERWPAVCADCAPKVNDRIRTSNYQVKVASLGQMLARSSGYEAAAKGGESDHLDNSGWKRFERAAWWFRGGVWSYFHFLVLAWHGSAALHPREAFGMDISVASWPTCVLRSIAAKELDVHCYGVAAGQAARWIPLSALGFFWIYRERDLLKYPHKKLVGAREYVKLECCIYVFRLVSWYFVAPGGSLEFTEETFARLHLGLLFLSLVSTLFSVTCLKLEDPPSFSLREPEPIPSTPSPPSSPPQRLIQQRHPMSPVTPLRPSLINPPPSTGGSTNYSPVKFRARDISPSPAPRRGTPARAAPLSPDAMDWNPTDTRETTTPVWRATPPPPQPTFTSFSSRQRQNAYSSPFTGALPPAPRAPTRRLTNQPAPTPQPARENFFTHRLGITSSTPQSASFSKVAAPTYRLGSPQYAPMAPQRFFLADEATGLETLMGGGLRLDDEPAARAPARREEAWWGVVVRGALLAAAALGLAFRGPAWVQPAMAAVVLRPRYPHLVLAESVGAAAVLAGTVYWRDCGGAVVAAVLALVWLAAREAWAVAIRLQRARARVFYEEERRRGLEREKEERRGREGSAGSDSRSRAGSAGLGFGNMGL